MKRVLSLFGAFSLILVLAACDSAEERAEEHYNTALALVESGDPDRAVVELRNVFRLVPNHLEARHELARLLLVEKNRPQQAYGQYLRLVEQYPDDLLARVQLSTMAFYNAQWDEFERHSERAIDIAPDDLRVRVLATALNYRAAVTEEDESLRATTVTEVTALMDTDAPDRILREILLDDRIRAQRFSEALEILDSLIAEHTEDARYQRQRLQILIALGDQSAIEEQLVDMVDRFPDDPEQKQLLIRYYLSRDELDKTEDFLRDLVAQAPEGDNEARVDLIRFLIELRGEDAALAEINEAIATAANPLPFVMIGATLDFTAGNTDRAIADLEAVIAEAEPSDELNDMKANLARMLVVTGNEVGARSLVETVLLENPSHAPSLKLNANWLIESDETDLAIAALRTVLEGNPDDAAALTAMARAYTRSGSPNLARDFLSLAVEASGNAPEETIRYAQLLISEGRYQPAEDILLPAIRIAPGNVDLLRTTGQLYVESDDFGRLQQVIDTLRRIGTPPALQLALTFEAAMVNETSGTDEVISYLEGLAEQSDAGSASQLLLLRARIATGDAEGALALAESFVEERPDNASARLILAKTLAAVGRIEDSLEIYASLTEEFPADADLIVEFASVQTRAGNTDAARSTVFTALEANPDAPSLMWAAASFYEQDGDIDAAIATYEALYEQDSSSLVAANNLASLLATYRNDPESLDRAWTVARRFRDSDLAPIQDTYGWIAHRRGDSEEALPYLESAAAALTNDAIVQFHLAEVLFALDNKERALDQYRVVLERAGVGDTRPQFQIARDRIAEIEAELEAITE